MQRPALQLGAGTPVTLRISSTGSYYNAQGDYTTNVDYKTNLENRVGTADAEASQHPDVGDVAYLSTTGWATSTSNKLFDLGNENVGSALGVLSNQNFKISALTNNSANARVSLRLEVYQNDAASMTIGSGPGEAELVQRVDFNNVTYTVDTQYTLSAIRFLLTKQRFFAKITMTSLEYIGGTPVDPLWEMGGNVGTGGTTKNNTVQAHGYLTKTMIMNKGFQSYAGEYNEARFGAENKIVGNMVIEEPPNFDTGARLAVENAIMVGTKEINENLDYKLYVDGDMGATGNVVAYVTSDERLKENITPMTSSLSLVNQMNPVNFRWNDDGIMFGWGLERYRKNLGYDIGFIAQELEETLPEVIGNVKDKKTGTEYLGVHYEKIVPVLVGAVKEQQKQIDELKELVNKLTEDK